MSDELINIGEAAEILDVSIDTLRRWDENGKLVAIRKEGGTHRYYKRVEIEILASDLYGLAFDWAINGTEFPDKFYCKNSSIFQARLVKMEQALLGKKEFEKLYSLIVLVTGEIGDNSFANNLGKWPDTLGIFFGYDIRKRVIVLADRGVGVLQTLSRIRPELSDHVSALKTAFTEFISGRAPEKRGNGLKLVREVTTTQPIDLLFMSGDGEVRIQPPDKEFRVTRGTNTIRGCLAKIKF